MLILGIESTCDETAASIVVDGRTILSNVIASQIPLHSPYGGVYPELASRSHINSLTPVIEMAISEAKITKSQIDLISVAKGPGLIGSLLIGLNAAKALSLAWEKPFVGVNHVEAHLYASMMGQQDPIFPSLGVVLSGGHTFLVLMEEIGSYKLLATTADDAVGEAFDKVAVMLGLPYPGGPAIEKLAKSGDSAKYSFKPGAIKGRPLDFSFSGLKTNVYYLIHGQNGCKSRDLNDFDKADIAASFQHTAFSDVIKKCRIAAEEHGCKAIYVGGGLVTTKSSERCFLNAYNPYPYFGPPLDSV